VAEPGYRGWRLVRATKTAIPASVRRFNARARARRVRSARPWFIAAAVLALAGVVSFLFYGTSLFGVGHVAVTFAAGGPGFVTAGEVRAAAAVPVGTPLAALDLGAVATRVEKLIGVARARVSRDWPATVAIEVTPRRAVAAVPFGEDAMLLDATGVVFHTVPRMPPNLVTLRLATPGPGDAATRAALAVLASFPPDLLRYVLVIEVPAPAQVKLRLAGDRTVIWGDNAENGTKARVVLSLLARPGKVIDVSAPPLVTVR
jgi:cell division protein FtsQ